MGLMVVGRDRRWIYAVAVVFLCGAIDVWAFSDRSRAEPSNLGVRRFVLGEIYDDYRIEQRLVPKADGLSSVTIYPRPASPAPTGTVLVSLFDVTDGQEPLAIRQVSAPIAELAAAGALTMRFPPQPSLHREYLLEVSTVGASDGQGIGLLATRGGGRDARFRPSMSINGRRQFGTLVFRTTVDHAVSNFGAVAAQLRAGGVPAAPVILTLIILLKNAALGWIVRVIAGQAGPSGSPRQTPLSPSAPG